MFGSMLSAPSDATTCRTWPPFRPIRDHAFIRARQTTGLLLCWLCGLVTLVIRQYLILCAQAEHVTHLWPWTAVLNTSVQKAQAPSTFRKTKSTASWAGVTNQGVLDKGRLQQLQCPVSTIYHFFPICCPYLNKDPLIFLPKAFPPHQTGMKNHIKWHQTCVYYYKYQN